MRIVLNGCTDAQPNDAVVSKHDTQLPHVGAIFDRPVMDAISNPSTLLTKGGIDLLSDNTFDR